MRNPAPFKTADVEFTSSDAPPVPCRSLRLAGSNHVIACGTAWASRGSTHHSSAWELQPRPVKLGRCSSWHSHALPEALSGSRSQARRQSRPPRQSGAPACEPLPWARSDWSHATQTMRRSLLASLLLLFALAADGQPVRNLFARQQQRSSSTHAAPSAQVTPATPARARRHAGKQGPTTGLPDGFVKVQVRCRGSRLPPAAARGMGR